MTFGHVADATTFRDTISATYTASKPAGTASGDLMVAFVEAIGSSASVTGFPSGWTRQGAQTGNSNILSECWVKVAGGSEPSSYSWTLSASLRGRVTIHTYTGQDPSTPIDAYNTGLAGLNVTAATPTLTVAGTGCILVVSAFGRHLAATHAFTDTTGGDAVRAAHGATAGGTYDYVCGTWDSAGAVGSGANSRTINSDGTENAIAWHALSIRPLTASATARIYQDFVDAPASLPPARARIYQDFVEAVPPDGGKTGRIYADFVQAPLPANHPGQSGRWALRNGTWVNVIQHHASGGQW